MEPSFPREESQFISVEETAEESHVRKKPKKTSSVRFAPEVTSIKPRIFSKDGELHLENLTAEDIKTEICSCLPSNTLGRRRLRSFSKNLESKAFTFPRQSSSDERDIPMSRLRHRSFVCNRKPSFLRSLGRLSSNKYPYASDEEQDSPDELDCCFTEEERRKELSSIRNIPVRLSQKRKYRCQYTMQVPRSANLNDGENDTYKYYPKGMPKNRHNLRTKYESIPDSNLSVEGVHDGVSRQKISPYSRYLEARNVSTSNIIEEVNPGSVMFSRSNLENGQQVTDNDAYSYEDQKHLIRNVQHLGDNTIYSDERHGARKKVLTPNEKAYTNSNVRIDDKTVTRCQDQYNSGSIRAASVFPNSNQELHYSSGEMERIKSFQINPEKLLGSRKKDFPSTMHNGENRSSNSTQHQQTHNSDKLFASSGKSHKSSKRAYYNSAVSVEDENYNPTQLGSHYHSDNNFGEKKKHLSYSQRAYYNSAINTDDENGYSVEYPSKKDYSSESKVKKVFSTQEMPHKSKGPIKNRDNKKQFMGEDSIVRKNHVKEKLQEPNSYNYNSSRFSEPHDNITENKLNYRLNRFDEFSSHLTNMSLETYFPEKDVFISSEQGRWSEIYGKQPMICKRRIVNQNTRVKGIEMKPLDNNSFNEKSLNMHDAFVIGKVMLQESDEESVTSVEDPQLLFRSENEDALKIASRQCWSKSCFSLSKHSHVYDKRYSRKSFIQKREAILETLPLHGPKDKSFWEKVKESCTCFRRISSALEIWNGTLKKIEGQQGTGVVSYFVFLRWLIALNLILFLLYLLLVTLPHAVFASLPLRDISIAPNETIFDEEYLSRFPSSTMKPKLTPNRNISLKPSEGDIISKLGIFIDKYLVEDILDATIYYDKRNMTTKERHSLSRLCESKYKVEMQNRTGGFLSVMQDLLQGTGWLQSTVLFLGYYSPNEISYFGLPYHLPVAIIFVLFLSFVVCLCMMIQYSSHGVQETILARKSNYLAYSNILFCSWDYCIEDRKSSVIRHNSILHEIKSTLNEERRKREVKEWSKGKKFRVYFLRGFINCFVICMLCGSYYLIFTVVNYQLEEQRLHRLNNPGVNTLFVQYLSPIVITCLNIVVPVVFTNIVKFEMYDTQTQINIALFRIVFLRLSSIFVLVGLLYQQITCQPKDQCGAGKNQNCRSPICWETYVGQQFYKLAVTDFFVYIIMFIVYDLPRDIIVRRFDNKVTKLIGRQAFDLPNQVLALVYSQTLCWLGIIYSPLLPVITLIKFVVLFHVKKTMVLKYCIPSPIPYKASRSNAMFMMILMMSFFTLLIIHGYSLSSIEPSAACSPFRHYFVMVDAVPDAVSTRSTSLATFINFIFSAIFLFPAILLLCIAIYYYWTIVIANRKMVKVLKAQILLEGRDKQFLLTRLTEVAKGHI